MKPVLYTILFYSGIAWISFGLFQYYSTPKPSATVPDITRCESYIHASKDPNFMQDCINNLAKLSLTDSCKITANFKYADLYAKTCIAEGENAKCTLDAQDQKDLMNYRNGYVNQCVTAYW